MVPRLFWICRIQWCCLFFQLGIEKFGANLTQKIKIVSLTWNSVLRLIWICQIQWWCSVFLFCTGNTLFRKRRLTKCNYCLCDLTGVETLKLSTMATLVETAFLFCWGECVRGLLLGTAFKILNNLKRKETFYFTWINFLFKKLSCQILIELFM